MYLFAAMVISQAFYMRQFDPLRVQLSLDDLPCLISSKGHNRSVHVHDRALTFAPGTQAR